MNQGATQLLEQLAVQPVHDLSALLSSPARLKAWPCSSASYEVGRLLGEGTFSRCFLAVKSSSWERPSRVALKLTPKYGPEPSRELEVMLLLRDAPHVAPTLYEYFYALEAPSDTSASGSCQLVLVMEAFDCTLRELNGRLVRETERQSSLRAARAVGQQLAPALAHLHGLGVIHRDIKCDNVLVRRPADGRVTPSFVLSDFGHAKRVSEGGAGRSTPYAYAPRYRPPELFFGLSTYSGAADVWALGCVLAEVLLAESIFCPLDGERKDDDPDRAAQRQLLALFECLGTPTWKDVLAMNPALRQDEERRRAWMGAPPRAPTRCWKKRLAEALATEGAQGEVHAAVSTLASIFAWDPAARPRASALGGSAFLNGPGLEESRESESETDLHMLCDV